MTLETKIKINLPRGAGGISRLMLRRHLKHPF
jgi:hypothetical protein